jgi:hypothetical protein
MTNIYLTKHRRLFADKPGPYRTWLLFLRLWYAWRADRHLQAVTRNLRKREDVLHQLSNEDEENENGVR